MGNNFRETLNERMKDAEFRAEWEALELERQRIKAAIEEEMSTKKEEKNV